ncbi:response regulator transcription factor [Actinomadura fulvescens]|uniref:response regulator transcription factor n=1 Tax=Actinomadura fulvescens TaxID=46160 RepID=UPI0031D39F08
MKVLVCDQLPIIRDGLRTALDAESDITVIDTTDSAIHAIMLVRRHRPNVVITGLHLKGMPGLEMIRRLAAEDLQPPPRFVVFAMSDSDEIIDDVLKADVNGLLVKDSTGEELGSAVRAAARGQTIVAPQVAQRLVDWFRCRAPVRREERLGSALAGLTPRERQVLELVARGLSAAEVAAELVIGVTTVRTHLYRLRHKLNVRDRAQLVSFAYRAGLMPIQDGPDLPDLAERPTG